MTIFGIYYPVWSLVMLGISITVLIFALGLRYIISELKKLLGAATVTAILPILPETIKPEPVITRYGEFDPNSQYGNYVVFTDERVQEEARTLLLKEVVEVIPEKYWKRVKIIYQAKQRSMNMTPDYPNVGTDGHCDAGTTTAGGWADPWNVDTTGGFQCIESFRYIESEPLAIEDPRHENQIKAESLAKLGKNAQRHIDAKIFLMAARMNIKPPRQHRHQSHHYRGR